MTEARRPGLPALRKSVLDSRIANRMRHVFRRREGFVPSEMNLHTAREVLQDVAGTPESTISDLDNIGEFGGHSVYRVREAVEVVGLDLVKTHRVVEYGSPGLRKCIEKTTDEGILRFDMGILGIVSSAEAPRVRLTLALPEDIEQWDIKYPRIVADFPLIEIEDPIEKISYKFSDDRLLKSVNLFGLFSGPEGLNVSDYRFMVRGVRWLSANMLNWDRPGVIMHEDLTQQVGLPAASDHAIGGK